jgi:putative peptidoglycan lipid II flippase
VLSASLLRPWWVSLKSSAKEMKVLRQVPIYSVASGIVIVAGLAREVVIASTFGLSSELDVLVAVMGFHLLFGVQVGNAIEHVFVSKTASQHGASVRPLIKRASLVLIVINVIALTLLVFGSRSVLQMIFPQFSVEQCDTGVRLIRLLLFPIACAGLAGLMRAGLSVVGRFAPVFLSGAVVSLSTIVSVLLFADRWGIDAMVWGFATGHFFVLLWFVASFSGGAVPPVTTNARDRAVRVGELWRPVLIVLIGEFFFQAVAMTERSFASGLGTGKIAAFFYAGSIVAVPLALFTAPVNTTLFPKLARAFHTGYREGRQVLIRYGAVLFAVTLLCSVFLALISEPLVEVALARGKFSTADARLTAHILSMLVWGLPFASLYGVVRNSFYSLSDYRTPLAGHGIRWVTLLLCGSWLIPLFGVEGLAVSSVAAQVTDTSMLSWLLHRRLAGLSEET